MYRHVLKTVFNRTLINLKMLTIMNDMSERNKNQLKCYSTFIIKVKIFTKSYN